VANRFWLTVAAFTAVARLAVIHGTIFARLFASGLIGRERAGANDCSQNRKDNFTVLLHTKI
jgi:hypothetical protein